MCWSASLKSTEGNYCTVSTRYSPQSICARNLLPLRLLGWRRLSRQLNKSFALSSEFRCPVMCSCAYNSASKKLTAIFCSACFSQLRNPFPTLLLLLQRQYVHNMRHPSLFRLHLFVSLIGGFVTGGLFYNVKDDFPGFQVLYSVHSSTQQSTLRTHCTCTPPCRVCHRTELAHCSSACVSFLSVPCPHSPHLPSNGRLCCAKRSQNPTGYGNTKLVQ